MPPSYVELLFQMISEQFGVILLVSNISFHHHWTVECRNQVMIKDESLFVIRDCLRGSLSQPHVEY